MFYLYPEPRHQEEALSTTTLVPLMCEAFVEARKQTVFAMSCGSLRELRTSACRHWSRNGYPIAFMGVIVVRGETGLTRIPLRPSLTAANLVKWSMEASAVA